VPGELCEGPQRRKHPLILGAGDRRGHPIPAAVGILHAQHVEKVPGQHQLDGSLVAVQVLQQQGELRGGLEDVAARRPPDVGVGQEHEQGVVRELVPDDAIGGSVAHHARPAAPAPFSILVTIEIIVQGVGPTTRPAARCWILGAWIFR